MIESYTKEAVDLVDNCDLYEDEESDKKSESTSVTGKNDIGLNVEKTKWTLRH